MFGRFGRFLLCPFGVLYGKAGSRRLWQLGKW